MTQQLALDIPAQRPTPTVVLRVDETGIALFAHPAGHARWELMRRRTPNRFTTVGVRMPGDLVDVTCDDQTHARWLADLLHSWGVPKSSLKIQTTGPIS